MTSTLTLVTEFPVFADEYEELTLQEITNKVNNVYINERENTNSNVSISIEMNEDILFDSATLNINSNNDTIISLDYSSYSNNTYTFDGSFEAGSYNIESVSITYGQDVYKIDLACYGNTFFAVSKENEESLTIDPYDYTYYPSGTVYGSITTVDQAINWLEYSANYALSYDFDHVAGSQCVDLIMEYAYALGAPLPSLMAGDYIYSGAVGWPWQRIPGGTPQPGDILVYPYHVAIYGGGNVTYHQNYNYASYTQKITSYAPTGNGYLGCIRFMNFIAPPTEVYLSDTFIALETSDSYLLSASTNSNAAQTYTWTSSDSSIASVSQNGVVTAIKKGTAVITVQTSNGLTQSCTVVVDNPTGKLEGYSLSLSGDIGVNFYMSLSQSFIDDPDAGMRFTMNGKVINQVSVRDATPVDINGVTYYAFKCLVGAKDLCTNIKAELMSANGPCQTYNYTVKEYADYILNHYSQSSNEYKITEKMLAYGHYAQQYFNYNVNSTPGAPTNVAINNVSNYTYTINGTSEDVAFVGVRLILASKPGLKLYFIGGSNFRVDNQSSNSYRDGKYTVLELNNIDDISHMYTIQADGLTLHYSVLSYANIALNSNNSTLRALMNTMINYYRLFKIF